MWIFMGLCVGMHDGPTGGRSVAPMLSVGTGSPPRYGRRRDDIVRGGPRDPAFLPPARTAGVLPGPVGPIIDAIEDPAPRIERGRLIDILV